MMKSVMCLISTIVCHSLYRHCLVSLSTSVQRVNIHEEQWKTTRAYMGSEQNLPNT